MSRLPYPTHVLNVEKSIRDDVVYRRCTLKAVDISTWKSSFIWDKIQIRLFTFLSVPPNCSMGKPRRSWKVQMRILTSFVLVASSPRRHCAVQKFGKNVTCKSTSLREGNCEDATNLRMGTNSRARLQNRNGFGGNVMHFAGADFGCCCHTTVRGGSVERLMEI